MKGFGSIALGVAILAGTQLIYTVKPGEKVLFITFRH